MNFILLPLTGAKQLIKKPSLALYLIIPLIINLGLFYIFSKYQFELIDSFLSWSWDRVSFPLWIEKSLNFILKPVFKLISLLLSTTLIIALGSILSSPFYAFMVEKLTESYINKNDPHFPLPTGVNIQVKMLFIAIKKTLLFASLGISIFILSFIPGLNFLAIYFTLFVISFDSFDYAFESLGWDLGQRLKFILKHPFSFHKPMAFFSLGFLIPFLNLFLYPFYILGATHSLLHSKIYKRGHFYD